MQNYTGCFILRGPILTFSVKKTRIFYGIIQLEGKNKEFSSYISLKKQLFLR